MSADFTRTPLELMVEIEEVRMEMRALTNSLHETNLVLAKVAAERDALLELALLTNEWLSLPRGGAVHDERITKMTAVRRRLLELGVNVNG